MATAYTRSDFRIHTDELVTLRGCTARYGITRDLNIHYRKTGYWRQQFQYQMLDAVRSAALTYQEGKLDKATAKDLWSENVGAFMTPKDVALPLQELEQRRKVLQGNDAILWLHDLLHQRRGPAYVKTCAHDYRLPLGDMILLGTLDVVWHEPMADTYELWVFDTSFDPPPEILTRYYPSIVASAYACKSLLGVKPNTVRWVNPILELNKPLGVPPKEGETVLHGLAEHAYRIQRSKAWYPLIGDDCNFCPVAAECSAGAWLSQPELQQTIEAIQGKRKYRKR